MSKNIQPKVPMGPTHIPPKKPIKITKVQVIKKEQEKEVPKNKATKIIPSPKIQKTSTKPSLLKEDKPKGQIKQKCRQVKLANLVDQISAEKCNYLIDRQQYSTVFFKYKGRLIDIPQMMIQMAVGNKTKEQIIQQIRKSLLWGIKTGDMVYFRIESIQTLNELMKGASFWQPKKIFVPHSKIDTEWYLQTLLSKNDPSPQQYYPGEYKMIIGCQNSLPLSKISGQIGIDAKQFIEMEII